MKLTPAQRKVLWAIYRTGDGILTQRSWYVLSRLKGFWRYRKTPPAENKAVGVGPRELTDTGLVALGFFDRCGNCAACQEAILHPNTAPMCRKGRRQ